MCCGILTACLAGCIAKPILCGCNKFGDGRKFVHTSLFFLSFIAAALLSVYGDASWTFMGFELYLCPNQKNSSFCYSDQVFVRLMGAQFVFYLVHLLLAILSKSFNNMCWGIKIVALISLMMSSLFIPLRILIIFLMFTTLFSLLYLPLQAGMLINLIHTVDQEFDVESKCGKFSYLFLAAVFLAAGVTLTYFSVSFFWICNSQKFAICVTPALLCLTALIIVSYKKNDDDQRVMTIFPLIAFFLYLMAHVFYLAANIGAHFSGCNPPEAPQAKLAAIPVLFFVFLNILLISYYGDYQVPEDGEIENTTKADVFYFSSMALASSHSISLMVFFGANFDWVDNYFCNVVQVFAIIASFIFYLVLFLFYTPKISKITSN